MKTNIFIPKKIEVGFQNRSDTYTKKLAYVIYYDQKDVLRKEKSWNSWRDKKIDPMTLENVPTSGFVLNKKAGGYSTGWNHRQTYVRIYDPRDFEFEITIPNLLYILENTNSIKGKGLEGEFVYGWDGKDLILIPTSSPDYIEISQFNEILHQNNYVKAKDLILGATYKTKDNEEWIYMGRFDYHTTKYERVEIPSTSGYSWSRNYKYEYKNLNKGKHYYFARETNDYRGEPHLQFLTIKSLGEKFIETVSSDCVENYAMLFDKLECTTDYSPHDKSKDEYLRYTLEEFVEYVKGLRLDYYSNSYLFKIKTKENFDDPIAELRYDKENDIYYIQGSWDSFSRKYIQTNIGSIEDVFNKYQPVYKKEYLENGKFYRRVN